MANLLQYAKILRSCKPYDYCLVTDTNRPVKTYSTNINKCIYKTYKRNIYVIMLYVINEKHCFHKVVKIKLETNNLVKLWRCLYRKFIFCKFWQKVIMVLDKIQYKKIF